MYLVDGIHGEETVGTQYSRCKKFGNNAKLVDHQVQ